MFGTPVAAVLLAVELLLFEWKPRSFMPGRHGRADRRGAAGRCCRRGAAVSVRRDRAAICRLGARWLRGVGIARRRWLRPADQLVYGCEDLFQQLPIHWMWWPAIGGLVVGLGGLIEPARARRRLRQSSQPCCRAIMITCGRCVLLLLVKAVIWSVALGSGTSGGVLAPLLIMGGALGALFGHLVPPDDPALWALVGMAAMMGGTMRSPLTAIVFAHRADRQHSRAAAAAGRLRRGARRHRAAAEALDPHREGRAARPCT